MSIEPRSQPVSGVAAATIQLFNFLLIITWKKDQSTGEQNDGFARITSPVQRFINVGQAFLQNKLLWWYGFNY